VGGVEKALKSFADFYFIAASGSGISGPISERFRDAGLPWDRKRTRL
jgi:hypothetical protein